MEAGTGERLRPLPARDARGRFLPTDYGLEALLKRFDQSGTCRFPDPWQPKGWYVIETRRSLKGFPVAMHYEGPLKGDGSYSGVIKYGDHAYNWGTGLRRGEVAVSPMPHFGDPREGWGEGQWGQYDERCKDTTTRRQLAALYIHLVHSVDLHTKTCGQKIGVAKNY